MDTRYIVSLVLNAHLPFVKDYYDPVRRFGQQAAGIDDDQEMIECAFESEQDEDTAPSSVGENWFF
jgi:hypothetical protein